ncbi:DUF3656 domain-containing protein [Oceanotoga sp. DSM 15011]|uniref:DUF3656 domain-containing U32 family peptidase n=1 Tax=Oceanotoga sp. DSM 15011 TaxID=2984951 RepID=UPI0021F4CA90|nr:U32 family peptidase [Oceanotoga sp. DSM 15011]UYO99405.1 DUF3656 domain-containing protein [Oceanotoga sp. DSM 15011]
MKVELLAPAGNFESMKAAFSNGADAVYLGGKSFNARSSANNFDDDELKMAINYAHLRDKKVHITFNTLINDFEIDKAIKYLDYIYSINADAIIVQDTTIAYIIKNRYPDLPIHASTQMSVHNTQTAKLLKEAGFTRIIPARETSLRDIENIINNVDIEIETFIHGALCVSYSGQCLMSSLIGGRSGNRGKCAQPCRMQYSLVKLKEDKIIKDAYILSTRDLNTIDKIPQLIKSGIKSFKIEGRMKKPQYVAIVVNAYRKAIDSYYENTNKLSNKDIEDMTQIFNRTFTKGYTFNEYGNEIVNTNRPDNRGLELGRTISYDSYKKLLKIKLIRELNLKDGIEVIDPINTSKGTRIDKIYIDDKEVQNAQKDEIVEIPFKFFMDKNLIINKTYDEKLNDKAKKSYDEDLKVPLNIEMTIIKNNPIELILKYKNLKINQKSDFIVEKSEKKPTSKENIEKNISKLGNTPYFANSIIIKGDEDIFIPISKINELRRNAIEELDKKRLSYSKEIKNFNLIKKSRSENALELNMSIINPEQFINNDRGNTYLYNFKNYNLKENTIPAYSRITENDEIEEIKKQNINSDKIMVGNPGLINIFKNKQIILDYSFNIFNSYSHKIWNNENIKKITLSPEMNIYQMQRFVENTDIDYEVIIYGRIPAMISKYCAISSQSGPDKPKCNLCKESDYSLIDKKYYEFPIITDLKCRMHVLNSFPLNLYNKINEMKEKGIKKYRLFFTNEKKSEIEKTYSLFSDLIFNENYNLEYEEEILASTTKGHYFSDI